ncbi:30S ribosomal protein S4 [Candidatus Woesearchaeota archaeon]|nr:30S ribosomal protein S4 [Candidatus Woesearchaeota archaeon]
MGDPKRQRKKYQTSGHPWQAARIEEEKHLTAEYGFKNKTEIWKHVSFLRTATTQAKKLVTLSTPQAEKEKELLLGRLKRYGLLSPEAGLDAILSISLRDVMERRLQTRVYKHNLANSVRQARQFITHEHIAVNGRIVSSPSYLVPLAEEGAISFVETSSLSDEEHPERVAARRVREKEAKERVIEEPDPGKSKGAKPNEQKPRAKRPAKSSGPKKESKK